MKTLFSGKPVIPCLTVLQMFATLGVALTGENPALLAPPGAKAVQKIQAAGSQPILRLEDLEQMALQRNPTLAQAAARVRAAAGRKLQAGLYPNPLLGVIGDENSAGPIIRGGEFGVLVEQSVVTAGKLRLSKNVFDREQAQAEAEAEKQKFRVLNSVRQIFYQALGAERLVELRSELSRLTQEAVTVSQQLFNVGQADQPDVLQAEIEAEQAAIDLATSRNEQTRIWAQLASIVGNPTLKPAPLAGNLEATPQTLDQENVLASLLKESPEIRSAQEGVSRADFALRRARVEKIPDIQVRGGLRYNRELLERGGVPVGLEGFFDIGVRIPLFNRNQGNILAAQADQNRAELEVERVKLSLHARLASAFRQYRDAQQMVDKYRDEMLPRAQKSYDLYFKSFQQMAAAYPQVLIAQRTLFQLRVNYIKTLVKLWSSVVELRGFLLTDGLSSLSVPAESTSSMADVEIDSQ